MLKIDLHIHTVHSSHAYGSFYDVLKEAKSKGLDMIGITDHGPDIPGSAGHIHFKMGLRAPKDYEGMKVLWGCEANIIDDKGTLDIDEETIRKMDILLLGIHKDGSFKDLGKEKNTDVVIKCFEKYPLLVFTHPSLQVVDLDIEKVFQAAIDNNILLELNLASLRVKELGFAKEEIGDMKKMVDFVKKHNKKLIINSDAHFLHELGDDSLLEKYWNELGLSDDIIINNYPEELNELIASKDLKNFKLGGSVK